MGAEPSAIDATDGAMAIAVYSSAIAAGEVASMFGYVTIAAIVDVALIPVLLGQFAWGKRTPQSRLLAMLVLVALVRVLSVAAVIPRLPVATWYATVGGTLLIGELLAIRFMDMPAQRLRLAIRRPAVDLALVAVGIPAGLLGGLLLGPVPFLSTSDPAALVAAGVALVLFAAFPEELLFRGILQGFALEALGSQRAALLYTGAMSAAMYLGSGSLPYTVLMGAYGLYLGWGVLRGGSIWGATASHAIALLGMAFVWPRILGFQ